MHARILILLAAVLGSFACSSDPASNDPAARGSRSGSGGTPAAGATSGGATGSAGTTSGSGGSFAGSGGGAGETTGGATSGGSGGTSGSAGGGGSGGMEVPVWSCSECPDPPANVNDWVGGHGVPLTLHEFDDHAAVYVDDSVDTSVIDWVLPFVSESVVYMKQTYDQEHHYGDDRLYVFLHQDDFGGGTISSYFDGFSDFRNAIDMGSGTWVRSIENINIDLISHELCHIVEGSSNGIHESPAFTVWGDSKWGEIFQYDLYFALGMTEDAEKMYERFIDGNDDGTYWFRDWFYPLWETYGGSAVLNGFFKQLAEHFPTQPENDGANPIYTRRMNLGEFVHFYSGAAGADLTELATTAFGDGFLEELAQAKLDFPDIEY